VHTFFPDRRWSTAGGDFQADADATTQVASASSVWESAGMTARVQQWLDQPAANFGWIVIGNEARSGSAKRFDSREASTSRPSLTIEFQR
jgi:homospermidine synthase